MAKKIFKLRAKLVFSGEFQIRANNKEEAKQILKNNVGAMLGEIQTLNTDDIDWDFCTNGEIVLNKDYGKEDESEQ